MRGHEGSTSNGVGVIERGDITCPRCNGEGVIAVDSVTIGDRLRGLRSKAGWRQEDIAREIGVTRAQLANLEGDRSLPGLETLIRVAKVYHVSVDYLLGLKL